MTFVTKHPLHRVKSFDRVGPHTLRVEFGDGTAREAQRFDMGRRIREVEQGPDGALWLLEDQRNGSGGRLLKLTRAQ